MDPIRINPLLFMPYKLYYMRHIICKIWYVKHEKNSKERYGKPRTFQKGLTYDMCENVCVSNQTCNFFTHTPKGLGSHAWLMQHGVTVKQLYSATICYDKNMQHILKFYKMSMLIQLKGSCTLIFDQEAVLKRSQSHKAVRVWIW